MATGEVDFKELIKKIDKDGVHALLQVAKALEAGGEAAKRVERGEKYFDRLKSIPYADRTKAIEAIATGNLDGLPDYLADILKEVISP